MADSSNIENKTKDTKETTPKADPMVVASGQKNVLNGYRSYTYNFTLAALKKSVVNDPKAYRDSALELVIAKSGGKGTEGIQLTSDFLNTTVASTARTDFAKKDPRRVDLTPEEKSVPLNNYGQELINGFNSKSPGRFDMYIEQVEIENLMGFSEDSSTSLPTSMKFEIIEPYSINGFIEAIHVAAVSAGYPTYSQASFVLKMEFIGYPDNESLPEPELIPNSTRYFVFGFTGIDVEVTERGTKYRCAAVPFEQKGFGQPSVLKKPTPMSGNTVQEILSDLMNNINKQVASSDKNSKDQSKTANKHDTYKIVFPTRDLSQEGGWNYSAINDIGKSKVAELLKDNQLYKFPDPGTTTQANATKADGQKQPSAEQKAKDPQSVAYTYNPKKPQVQFADGAVINELIASVIRDSEYIRNKLKTIGTGQTLDEFGFMDYFLVKIEVKNLDVIDDISKKPFQEFTYVVTPYKIHYTRIPGYGSLKIDESKLALLSLRTYNYIYTGQNVDVLNFKLNFNTLFFEAIPSALGNNDQISSKTGAAPSNSVVPKQSGSSAETSTPDANGQAREQVDQRPNQVQQLGGNAGPVQTDPYSILAKNMHQAVVNSKASMLTGELEILGDPFFLVTGGIGNYNPKPVSRGVAGDGEADHQFGEVLVTIVFNNPIDIGNFADDGGLMYFDSEKVPFSGVYRVNKVVSTFHEGQFKQKLDIIRVPGQTNVAGPISDPANRLVTKPDPLDQVIPDATIASNPSARPTTANLLLQLGRGLPSPGLPGVLSNFTAALGGLGGSVNSLLNQVSGAVTSGIGKLTAAASVFGGSTPGGVDQLASGIRLSAAGLLNQSTLGSVASIAQVGNTLGGSFSVDGSSAAAGLVSNIGANAIAVNSLVPVQGSGIGVGATISMPSNITQASIMGSNLTQISPSNALSAATSVVTNNLTQVNGIGASAVSLVSNVGNQVAGLQTNVVNPTVLAAQFGINPGQLAGLSPDLQSKILTQAGNLASEVPSNTDLSAASAQGLVLDYIPAGKLANLPATTPFATAPGPEVDQSFLSGLVAQGGVKALANAYGVSDVSKISSDLLPPDETKSILNSVNSKLNNPLAGLGTQLNSVDVASMTGKLASANSQLSNITGVSGSVESGLATAQNAVGSTANLTNSITSQFGSKSQGTSPLDKLMLG